MITLSKTLLSKLESHAVQTYPEECCGAMLGSLDPQTQEKIVEVVIEIDNVSEENKKRRFMIKPEEYQRVEAEAKAQGCVLLGFYHSHPDHPPIPSETDLKFAWPVFSYVILSVEKAVSKICKSYVLGLESGKFEEEPVQFI